MNERTMIATFILLGIILANLISQNEILLSQYQQNVVAISQETAATVRDSNTTNTLLPAVPNPRTLYGVAAQALAKLSNSSSALQLAGIQTSTLNEITEKAILRSWKGPCVDPHPTSKRFTALVLGGSSSVRPSNNCQGRYSDILQTKLRNQGIDAVIHNRAQGSTTSTWSGMVLEQLVDPSQHPIDLLVWEHSMNDYANYNQGTADRMFAFWLTRVQRLFQDHNQTTPPILVLYLWRTGMGGLPAGRMKQHGIGYKGKTFQRCLDTVDYFTSRYNLNIEVLNVANLIRIPNMLEHRKEFIDDEHHPACAGGHLIADAVQYALFTNALNTKMSEECEYQERKDISVPTEYNQNNNATFQDRLLDPRTNVSVLSHWEPSLTTHRRQSSLLVTPESLQETSRHLDLFMAAKASPHRVDRKVSYRVPVCSTVPRTSPLQFTLQPDDPKRRWLGVAFKGEAILVTLGQNEPFRLEGEGLQQALLGSPINDFRQHRNFDWLKLGTDIGEMLISFCDNATAADRLTWDNQTKWSWVHLLVGVSYQ